MVHVCGAEDSLNGCCGSCRSPATTDVAQQPKEAALIETRPIKSRDDYSSPDERGQAQHRALLVGGARAWEVFTVGSNFVATSKDPRVG